MAPVVEPADARTRRALAKIWLPPSAARYIDMFNGTVYNGGQELVIRLSGRRWVVPFISGLGAELRRYIKVSLGGAMLPESEARVYLGNEEGKELAPGIVAEVQNPTRASTDEAIVIELTENTQLSRTDHTDIFRQLLPGYVNRVCAQGQAFCHPQQPQTDCSKDGRASERI
ncbi:hypothetical protein CORC01_00292 [Colletotrichum orchidophilum]|uniref:Uncharacterized protein n=1 Tax=Colletotrichum orchidophilum TaxID=1209926 RepID=A0A1G4BSQ9_9PEZI|nr:uncharacterized protein CORC01_00292 [Colletotrichum orchidophilum]OHF04440.1 hypothetical protein CORC01_00292 [Colletotrichum orchidophilum]